MRRIVFALAVCGLAAAAPLSARSGDREIAQQIIAKLKEEKAAGHLQGFDIDLKVEGGVVWVKGRVATAEQADMVLETARLMPGVSKVMKNIEIKGASAVAETDTSRRAQLASVPAPPAPMPTAAPPQPAPRAMQPAQISQPESVARYSSRRSAHDESVLQLLTGPAVAQPVSLAPQSAPQLIQPASPPMPVAPPMSVQVSHPAPATPIHLASATEAAPAPVAMDRDREVGRQVGAKLKQEVMAGRLDGKNLAFKMESGVLWIKGTVASAEQEALVVHLAQSTPGVSRIMKDLEIQPVQPATISAAPMLAQVPAVQPIAAEAPSTQTVQAAATQAAPAATAQSATPAPAPVAAAGLQRAGAAPQLVPANPYYGYPYAGYYPAMNQSPVAFAPAQPASAQVDVPGAAPQGGMAPYCPTGPMAPVGAFGGAGVRYDHPSLPAYAWPTYAAYPNYAAVTYPKQYSPTVWPYIGPFYPYPQVPLGWRKVVLEWDDGWWQLDFKDQSRPWKQR